MARIFYRQYARCSWDPGEPEAPLPGLTLREWEVSVILCSQREAVADALREWLEAPTDRQRWPAPSNFSSTRALLTDGEVNQPLETRLEWFYKEIVAIRQTLDFPIEAFCGISRNVLLAAHGQRLRLLVRGLGLKRALAEVARYTHPGDKRRAA
ncbi:MAG TPA: hypothetical protein VFU69_10630 [Ktedonobacterales bacterium]|nr:hypothetical protein [Ktedonobacterales bacterium]